MKKEITRLHLTLSHKSSDGKFSLDELEMSGPMIGGCHVMSREQLLIFCQHREEIEAWEAMYA